MTVPPLFLAELRERFDAEHQLASLLMTLSADAPDVLLKTLYQQCLQVATDHIHSLERCFACCDTTPLRARSLTSEALIRLYAVYRRAHLSAALFLDLQLDLLTTMTALAETDYQHLIARSTPDDFSACLPFLQENLEQTIAMTQRIEGFHGMPERNHPVVYPCTTGI